METPVPKFNKSFEALYRIAINMADQLIGNNKTADRINKLKEEFKELLDEVEGLPEQFNPELMPAITGEYGDVLFVLLHLGHKLGIDPFAALHGAASKMLARMNDKNYIAKN